MNVKNFLQKKDLYMKKLYIISLLFLKHVACNELPKHCTAENINDSLLTTLTFTTNTGGHLLLELTEEELKSIAPGKLETYLEEHNLYTKDYPSWSYPPVERTIIKSYIKEFIEEKQNIMRIKKQEFNEELIQENNEAFTITPKKASLLYNEATKTIESFLPKNDEEQNIIIKNKDHYKIKNELNFNDIFVHTKIEQTIKEKNLRRIKLSDKFILIKDSSKNEYVNVTEAKKLLKGIIRFNVTPKLLFCIDINYLNQRFIKTNYQVELFIEKPQIQELRKNNILSKEAKEELHTTFNTIPFKMDFDTAMHHNTRGEVILSDLSLASNKADDLAKLKSLNTF